MLGHQHHSFNFADVLWLCQELMMQRSLSSCTADTGTRVKLQCRVFFSTTLHCRPKGCFRVMWTYPTAPSIQTAQQRNSTSALMWVCICTAVLVWHHLRGKTHLFWNAPTNINFTFFFVPLFNNSHFVLISVKRTHLLERAHLSALPLIVTEMCNVYFKKQQHVLQGVSVHDRRVKLDDL